MTHPSLPARTLAIACLLLSCGAAAGFAAAPIARDDRGVATDRYLETVGSVETYSILIDVTANDEDTDGDPLVVVVQGAFGGPPAIWQLNPPVGTVQYLGGGMFEVSFGKDALGDAREVTFQYELEGAASAATVHVTVAGDGPPPEIRAQNDTFTEPWACWIPLPVLANDTGLDIIQSFTQPSDGVVQRDAADPDVLIYRAGAGGTFTYTAASSASGDAATATVTVGPGNPLLPKSASTDFGEIVLADCFGRADGTNLDGLRPAYNQGGGAILGLNWTAAGITHLNESGTIASSLPGGSSTRRKAYLPVFTGTATEISALQVEGTFSAAINKAEWVALAFTHGGGSVFTESDLWVQLDVETGGLSLNGRWDAAGLHEVLGTASPAADGYPFVQGGVNRVRLRYDSAPAVPKVDVWMNGVRVFSRVTSADVTSSMENVGFFVDYGLKASAPGDVWFDDFEFRAGAVNESILAPKSGSPDPDLGTDVANGGAVDLGPLHLGCTPQHVNCYPSREASLWLRNDGNEALNVSNVQFESGTDWTLLAPTMPSFSIAPGTAERIRVQVDALELGATSSHLEVQSDDPDLPKFTATFSANVTQVPVADFVHYCDGLSCSFDGGLSAGVGLSDFGFTWYLDGQFQRFGRTFDHTFAASGSHVVELRVTDATGAEHRLQRTVGIAPEGGFTYACDSLARTCDFDAATTTDGVTSFDYAFGDGTAWSGTGDPGAVIVQHSYATSGTYDVTLIVRDAAGQEDSVSHEVTLAPIADFTFLCTPETLTCELDASSSTPGLVAFEWSFGDGGRATGGQATHVYATSGLYSVALNVIDSSGQVGTIAKTVAVPPVAAFTVACDPDLRRCSFDGSGSTPGVDHAWSFGDGSQDAVGATQEHTYATSGIFPAVLTVTDSSGQTATSSRPVVIPPRADFSFVCDSLTCEFDAGGSTPGVSTYAWTFGHPGGVGSGAHPSHGFPDSGTFQVSLTVTDLSGQSHTVTKPVTVFDEELFLLILLD
jgi:PKD repeat protein